MKQYLDLLQKILDEGCEKESGRANMPNTIGISHAVIKMDLQEGFPLLTTKKMYWKGIVHELLWFLRGESNIKYLVDNNVNIWNGDAYRWYLKHCNQPIKEFTYDEFVDGIKNSDFDIKNKIWFTSKEGNVYHLGDLGKVYGYQWRNQNGVDQIKDVIDGLKTNPYSRYHIIDGWNKADFKEMALPPCHLLYQFIVRPLSLEERREIAYEKFPELKMFWGDKQLNEENIPRFYLDLSMFQRSVDTPLGNPYNLASMSLLLMIIAKTSNMVAGVATWIGGDTHIYVNQLDGVKEQLKREPYKLPQMVINKELNSLEDILSLTIDDFELTNYVSHPAIKFELSVGLSKDVKK